MSIYETRDWKKTRPYFVEKIKDFSIDLNEFVDEYLSWMESPNKNLQGRCDAYAVIYREVLGVDKNGKDADPDTWGKYFDRVKDLHMMIMENGSVFAKMISCEGLAHRYLDMHLRYGRDEDFKECSSLYKAAHNWARTGKFWKNVDSSFYWLGMAYVRCDNYPKAITYFCKVANRKGKRYNVSSSFNKKLKYANNCCKRRRIFTCKEMFKKKT